MASTWATRQAELQQQVLTEARVTKLRRLYWLGVGSLALNGAPAISLGGYAWSKSNEFDGVTCFDANFAPVLEPTGVTSNMWLVGFFLIGGAVAMLAAVYTVIVWYERMQQVSRQPKLKGKVLAGVREFGTTGVLMACCVFSTSVFCYVMFLLSLLLLSASVAGASEECGEDEGAGGQMFSAAKFSNGMSWLYIFVTGGQVVLMVLWARLRQKKALAQELDSEAPGQQLGHHQDDTQAEDLERISLDGAKNQPQQFSEIRRLQP